MQVPFGEWLPDQPAYLNPGANEANNVYYAARSYKPFPSLVKFSTNNIGADSKGAGSFRSTSNVSNNFASTQTNIYKLDQGSFTSVKGSLTGTATDFFTFTQFGDYIIASNGVDAPLYYLMGTSTNFANLSTIATAGTPPVFRTSGVIRDFLVTGNQSANRNRVQWCGINDITTWTPGTKQADLQDLPGSGGQIVAITSGEYGYVFRQNDGFFEVSGDQVKPIGAEKVNRFFDVDLNKAFSDRIVAAVDPFNQLAIWLYPSSQDTANTSGICDRVIVYNYVTEKWSIADASASTIFTQFLGAYTVEQMDLISGNLDNINISLDTAFWDGGQLSLGAINSSFESAIFSGDSGEVTLETSELELFPGLRSDITEVRPIVDANATVAITTREKLVDQPVTSSYSSMVSSGTVPVRQSGRYIRANVKIPAGTAWKDAQGVNFVASRAGGR